MGSFLIASAQIGKDLPDFLVWGLTALVLISSYVAIKGIRAHALFWEFALENLEIYGPNKERHKTALEMFDYTKEVVEPYNGPAKFYLAFAASLVLMAGLLMQELYLPLIAEVASSAFGFGFIHYFQVNKFDILGQITGTDEAA